MKLASSESVIEVYKRDNDYSLQFNRWFLKLIGAWPEVSTNSMIKNILTKILQLTCHSLIAFIVIPATLYILFEEKDIRLKLKAIGPTSHCLMGGINYCSLLHHSDQIWKSVKHMEADWRMAKKEHDREVMLRNARVGRVIAGVCALIMQGGVLCYNFARGMSHIDLTIGNETITTGRLPCPTFNKIVDTRISPIYEVVLVLQCLSTFVVNNVTIAACGLAAVFAMHGSGQLDVAMLRLEELVDEKQELLQLRLANVVKHHLRALKFLSRMEQILRQICFVELVGCTFNLCMLGYYTITEWHEESLNTIITYIMLITSMMFNIFIFCFIGELVTGQCKKVGEAAYMTNWYQLPNKTILGLILIILRSRTVIKITAGKIFHMSIATFGVVIKTSVGYLNMLRTLTV
ncbi:Odorant receptor 185 [Nylanderia fulva]|uniref:Odorant receptor n=1 Tax=Nylanderia fulva TaxID=613905 RepID=A0A6G1LPM3_9HYME|nr:odorant receptor 82a-like [Nylanderia fulva]KAF3054512.1 Odorant receptor 185 [Nylanderia fulva]